MAMSGHAFLDKIAEVLNLGLDVSRVIIDAQVGAVVRVIVVRIPDKEGLSAVVDLLNAGDVSIVDATAAKVPFAEEVSIDGQRVRHEAPTLEGLQQMKRGG